MQSRKCASLTILLCLQDASFESNAGVDGGAVRVAMGALASFQRCSFWGNMAASGSAIFVEAGAAVESIDGCTFYNNTQLIEYASSEAGSSTVQPVDVYKAYALDVYARRYAVSAVRGGEFVLHLRSFVTWPCASDAHASAGMCVISGPQTSSHRAG